jgi:phosphoglycolate phosphatase
MWRKKKIDCLLFDLDGTLIDSRADLVTGVNSMLKELGWPGLELTTVVGFVGEGARLLVERSLRASMAREPLPEEIDHGLAAFRTHYRAHLLDQTHLYPGVDELLDRLQGFPKAIVTNKPYDFTIAILDGLGLRPHFPIVLGGDSLPLRKPSPEMLLEAARRSGVPSAQCLMIGDSRIDVLAGRAAKMTTCGYLGGFRGREELVEAGTDLLFETFADLIPLLGLPPSRVGDGSDAPSGSHLLVELPNEEDEQPENRQFQDQRNQG